ncbi:hypothetical protein ACEPAG_8830 [Sanghuangporus baumii]
MRPRPLDYCRIATRIFPDAACEYGSLAGLYQVAWGKRDLKRIFHDHDVQRDSQQDPQRTVKVLRWVRNVDVFALFKISSILVRNEYLSILLDILRDVLLEPPGDTHDAELSDILLDYLSRPLKRDAAIVIGSAGIGKSLFLFFILALRVLAGLPTIFQSEKEHLCAITHDGVFRIDYPISFEPLQDYIPKGSWSLVDSGDVPGAPYQLVKASTLFSGFILQVTSPRKDRLEWSKKMHQAVKRCYMTPWTPEELIQARDLQVWHAGFQRPSEQALLDFCRMFGCSARHVYGNTAESTNYRIRVSEEITALTTDIRTALYKRDFLVFDKEIPELIMTAAPDPSNRARLTLFIASEYLTDQILARLKVTDQRATAHLYRLFMKNPYTRLHTGYLLERLAFESFSQGGQWEMTVMQKDDPGAENTYWHSRVGAPHRFLCLGYGQSSLSVEDQPQTGPFRPLPNSLYPMSQQQRPNDGFYSPASRAQPSSDIFVYDAAQSAATVFQTTVSRSHRISTVCLDWLTDLGSTTIDLVVVTDPKDTMEAYVSNSHRVRLRHVYHLVLHGDR